MVRSLQLLANAEASTTTAAVTPCQPACGEKLLAEGMGRDVMWVAAQKGLNQLPSLRA